MQLTLSNPIVQQKPEPTYNFRQHSRIFPGFPFDLRSLLPCNVCSQETLHNVPARFPLLQPRRLPPTGIRSFLDNRDSGLLLREARRRGLAKEVWHLKDRRFDRR